MISRDLTCDETMPIDDGDNMIGMRNVRTNASPIVQNNMHSSIPLIRNSNDVLQSTMIGSSRHLLNEIGQDESQITVREVVNRQIRNSKLKNDANLEKFGIFTSKLQEFDGKIKKHNRHTSTTNGNGRLASGGTRKNQITANKNEIIVPQSTTDIAEPIVVSINHKTNAINNNNSSPIFNCHQLPPGSHLVRLTAPNESGNNTIPTIIHQQPIYKEHTTQISNGYWAQHPPDSTTVQQSQQQFQYNNPPPKQFKITRTVMLPEPSTITTTPSTSSSSTTSIIVHHQTNSNKTSSFLLPPNDGSTKVFVVNEQQTPPSTPNNHHHQQQKASTTPHSSPKPSILRNSMRRLVERPASASSICDSFGNGQTRIVSCSSQGVEDLIGGEDSPRKKPRKQYFGETTQQQDKLMMEVYANLHGQQSTSTAALTIIQQQSSINPDQTKCSSAHISTHSTISEQKKVQQISKKRGRPKNNSKIPSSAHSSFKYVPENVNSTKPAHKAPSNLNLMSTGIVNGTNMVQQTPRVMVDVDSIIQDSTVKKRKYKKRLPETDPNTGEIIKKERKKGSGRKSKREEKAALQQKESAILAGIGITTAAANNHHHNLNARPSTSTIPMSPNYAQQHYYQSQRHIDAKEEDVIRALCRFRRDSEQQQQREVKEKTEAQKMTLLAAQKPSTSGSALEQKEKLNKHTKIAKKNEQLIAVKESHFPLLSDLMKKMDGDLKGLLKNCEKELNPVDNDHLLESYNKLNNLLAASSSSTADNEFNINSFYLPETNKSGLEEIYDRVTCSVFDSYGQFKSFIDHLRLLPKAIGYFEASQRFLHSIRTNLLGHSYYTKQKGTNNNCFARKVEKEEETIKLVALPKMKLEDGNDEGSNNKAEKLHRTLFEKIFTENWKDNTNDLLASEKLLLQLDVAQTLDSVVDRVDRNQINSREFVKPEKIDCAEGMEMQKTSAQNSPPLDSIYFSLISKNTLKRVPKSYLELFQQERSRKLQKMEKWNDKEEYKDDDKQEEMLINDKSINLNDDEKIGDEITGERHWKALLDTVGQICEKVQHNLDRLDQFQCKFHRLFEQLKEEDGMESKLSTTFNMEFPKLDIQMKKNLHKSCQFLFRPPNAIVGELFKDIADLVEIEKLKSDDEKVAKKKVEKTPSTSEIIGAQKSTFKEKQAQCDDQQEIVEEAHTSTMVFADLKELMDNSRHISTLALARLKSKFPEKFDEKSYKRQYGKNAVRKGFNHKLSEKLDDSSQQQFKPSIQYSFPPDSALEKQQEFLKDQMREALEVYKTAADLMQNRMEIAKECADCIQEIFDGKAEFFRSNSQLADRKSEELLEHQRHCDTQVSPSIPIKRKAHWRALSNIQSTSLAASISRGGSTEMMMDVG